MTESSENRINKLNKFIQDHVDDIPTILKSCELRVSSDFGCGVFATRDIKPNELLFCDRPLMLGPTGHPNEPIVCVICYERIENNVQSHLCAEKCGLILCGEQKCADQHKNECLLLQKWTPKNPDKISFKRTRAMLAIRFLFLDKEQKNFFDLMQKNCADQKNEIFFDNEFEHFPKDADIVDSLQTALAVINTNTFKLLYHPYSTGDVCIRSFYPTMSLLNHTCSPNTRHDIDNKFLGRIIASRTIKKDEQIFISYSQLLWGTNSRRMHMMVSKQFLCTCNRCLDPTECSTNLSAIRCQEKHCEGLVLPIEPINFKSDAKCNSCNRICENKRFLQIQGMAASFSRNFSNSNCTLGEIKTFLEMRLNKLVPTCSQFIIESKLGAVWKCQLPTGFEDLMTIKGFVEDILRVLDQLDIGESLLKGRLAHKLYTIRKGLKELSEWKSNVIPLTNMKIDAFLNDDERLLETAKTILMNSAAAPLDLNSL